MKDSEQTRLVDIRSLVSPTVDRALSSQGFIATTTVLRIEVVVNAMKKLWREQEIDGGEPFIFCATGNDRMFTEYHPILLDQLIADGERRKRGRFGQLASWKHIDVPEYAYGIAVAGASLYLLKAGMQETAHPGDRNTVPSILTGWFSYTFAAGWPALSVCFYTDDRDRYDEGDDVIRLVALPDGRQDEWLAFLALLDEIQQRIVRRESRGQIQIIGGDHKLAEVVRETTFKDVVLPPQTLELVAAQRRIFDKTLLQQYATLHVPRLRKVLLIGPPGTGKTTLLKAEGAFHAKQGGLVFYVCAPGDHNTPSWEVLANVLHRAGKSHLPVLILVEDFEMFVSEPKDMQRVLNTLDGIETPDNPAGTLLLATSNDPEKIDPRIRDRPGRIDVLIEIGLVEDEELSLRFLKHFLDTSYREEEHASLAHLFLGQPGSHFREVCIAGAMRALDQNRSAVLREDLVWAHEAILKGRALASEPERFLPPAARKRGRFFGKN